MIYFVRHGQAEFNVRGIHRGEHDDDALTELGKKQARAVAKELRHVKFDRVISSPYLRARQTATIIAGRDPDELDARVRERDCFKYARRRTDEFSQEDKFSIHREGVLDTETHTECRARVHEFINEVKSKYPGKNILVASHHDAMIFVHSYNIGEPVDGFYGKEYRSGNCQIVKIDNGGKS